MVFEAIRVKGATVICGVAVVLVLGLFPLPAHAQHMDPERDVALAHDVFFAARTRQDPVLYATAARLLAPHVGEGSVLIDWIQKELSVFPEAQIPPLIPDMTELKGVVGKSVLHSPFTVPGDGEYSISVEMEPLKSGLAFIVLAHSEDTRHLTVTFSGDWGRITCPPDLQRPGGYKCEWNPRRITTTVITITNTAAFDIQAHLTIQ